MGKKLFCFILLFSLVCSFNVQAIGLSASSAVLIDAQSGNIIYEKNAHTKMPMASTTKIMTAICAIENSITNFPVTVPDEAIGIEGSSIYLQKGEVLTLKELLYGLMLNSGNDAATAIAIEVSGSVDEFCRLMNKTAKNIGANNTNFTNPSGLYDENHYTTAYDLAIISAYAMKNPLFKEIAGTKEMKISHPDGSRYLKNHNKLLKTYDGCIGIKTGYTKKCGRCLVSAAQRDGVSLIAVTLNAPDDWNDHRNLLDYGFKNIMRNTIASDGDYALTANVSGVYVPLYFEESMTVSSVAIEGVRIDYTIKENETLPLNSGESLGTARLVKDGRVIASSALIADKNHTAKAKKNLWLTFCKILKIYLN